MTDATETGPPGPAANESEDVEPINDGTHGLPDIFDSASAVPELFKTLPPVRDVLETKSSHIQDETVAAVKPYLAAERSGINYNKNGIPNLDRRRHVEFLHKQLTKLPAGYTAADSSRPWMFYWCLAGLFLLGEDVTPYRQQLVDTVRAIQNPGGGFGGGFGQISHLCTTYAVILALAMVGGEEAYDVVDRRSMWKWLCSLKQPDGGFQVAIGAEEDVR
jgi:protein farnesyltransferase subunit beta